MAISASEVKKLKDLTNAGMMDCKKALEETNGDVDKALKILKEKGLADAKKRSDRETKEGGVYIKQSGNGIALCLLSCETDFVSGNEVFKKAKDKILDGILSNKKDFHDSFNDYVQEVISQTKENVGLKVSKYIEIKDNQYAATYIHGTNRIGVISVFELDNPSVKGNAELKEMADNICLHITASAPFYISQNEVPQNEIDEQKDIFTKQMADSGKKPEIVENIVKGKIQKHFSEICLLDQKYVKDDKVSVGEYIESIGKKIGSKIKVISFIRHMVGA
ncbi:MAG TPA: translation elongation factor Ts [Spirochaetota bacterium]|nr:translation elongation factor Ts [Spirochaetota bacterium]